MDTDVKELLGAYLAGDLRPDERAAVERLLASDSETRATLDSLRDVLTSVQTANPEVPPAMSAALRARLAPFLASEATSAALGAALAGELNASEREQVKKFIREHPQEKARLSAARGTGQWLKSQQPNASDAMSAALRSRLAAQIPALRGLETQVSRETTLVRTPPLPKSVARPQTSSLRVVAKEEPWRRYAWAGIAAAASVALAFSLVGIFRTPETNIAKGTTDDPKTVTPPEHVVVVPPQDAPETIVGPIFPRHETQRQPEVVQGTQPQTPQVPTPQTPKIPDTQERVVNPTPRVTPRPQDPERDPFQPTREPSVVEKDPKKAPATPNTNTQNNDPFVPNTQQPKVADKRSSGGIPIVGPIDTVLPPAPPDAVADAPRTGTNTGTGTTLNDNNPNVTAADPNKKPTAEPAPAPVKDAMVVVSVKNGNVVARQEGAAEQTLAAGQTGTQLSSGTELITTATSQISLTLPEGTLWINVSSRVTVRLSGSSTTVELSAGQIAYETSKGSLTVLAANTPVVTAAKNVDVRLENGALIAAVLGETAKVRGKTIQRGQQATVANLASTDAPKVAPVEEPKTQWRAEGPQRTVTGEQTRSKASRIRR